VLEPSHPGAAIERATALSHLRRQAEARETLARALTAAGRKEEADQARTRFRELNAKQHQQEQESLVAR